MGSPIRLAVVVACIAIVSLNLFLPGCGLPWNPGHRGAPNEPAAYEPSPAGPRISVRFEQRIGGPDAVEARGTTPELRGVSLTSRNVSWNGNVCSGQVGVNNVRVGYMMQDVRARIVDIDDGVTHDDTNWNYYYVANGTSSGWVMWNFTREAGPGTFAFIVEVSWLGPSAPTPTPITTYQFLRKWGAHGTESGWFMFLPGLAVDRERNVYVLDHYESFRHARVQKFTSNGDFVTKWGSWGSLDAQFQYPSGVAVDWAGNVYVADSANNRIQKFTSNGDFVMEWGSSGSGNGQFNGPLGVAADWVGNVYVADSFNNRIQKFTSNGNFVTKWGSSGSGESQFNSPHGVAVDSAGNVYVTDTNNHRIQKFNSSGTFLTQWGSQGSDEGQFQYPTGVAVDSMDNVYVADTNNHRIQKFTSNGSFVTKWGSEGAGDGQFNKPYGVAVDWAGNVYVADTNNHRIQVFEPKQQ